MEYFFSLKILWRVSFLPNHAFPSLFKAPRFLWRRIRAFFSGLPCVVSPFRAFGIAAGSHPPRCARRHLLRPHRSPYCLCARSLGTFTEKCPSCRATRFFLRCTCATPTSRRTCVFVGSGGCKQSSNICFFFFFNDTATTEIYTLSLHDALPICPGREAPKHDKRDDAGPPFA